jgi:hypothetical protein
VRELLDPPTQGERETARYLIQDEIGMVIGWTSDRKTALDYLAGFGPSNCVTIEDTRLHRQVVRTG